MTDAIAELLTFVAGPGEECPCGRPVWFITPKNHDGEGRRPLRAVDGEGNDHNPFLCMRTTTDRLDHPPCEEDYR